MAWRNAFKFFSLRTAADVPVAATVGAEGAAASDKPKEAQNDTDGNEQPRQAGKDAPAPAAKAEKKAGGKQKEQEAGAEEREGRDSAKTGKKGRGQDADEDVVAAGMVSRDKKGKKKNRRHVDESEEDEAGHQGGNDAGGTKADARTRRAARSDMADDDIESAAPRRQAVRRPVMERDEDGAGQQAEAANEESVRCRKCGGALYSSKAAVSHVPKV